MPDRKTIKKVKQYVYMGVVTKEEFVRLNKEELEKVKNSGSAIQKIFQLLLPPNFSHKNKKAATMKIVDTFQDQIKKNGSDARIKMFGDIPFAAPWWSWLLR